MNFVWFVENKLFLDFISNDLKNKINVRVVCKTSVFNSRLFGIFFRFIFSTRVNKYFKLPLKRVLYELLLKAYNIKNDDCVLIFQGGWLDKSFANLLKRKRIKTVLYFDDTIEYFLKDRLAIDPNHLRDLYDLVYAYNPEDAIKYGFILRSVSLSKLNCVSPKIDNDICFIGAAKDRMNELNEINKKIKFQCKCDFLVVGKEDGIKNGIVLTSKYMDYESYIRREISSNCILEILKGDTDGETLRCWEAVYYNKKLLTNWKGIFDFKYYNPLYMRYFSSPEDIDIAFIKERVKVDYKYENENSPISFLKDIESRIRK